jgi:hypothetical protein
MSNRKGFQGLSKYINFGDPILTPPSNRFWESTAEKPIQNWTNGQREPNVLQDRNKWWVDSRPPHLDTQKRDYGVIMPRVIRFVFIGNLCQKNVFNSSPTFLSTPSPNHPPLHLILHSELSQSPSTKMTPPLSRSPSLPHTSYHRHEP